MSTLTKLALGMMARQTLHELPQIHAHHSTDAAFDLIAEIEVANWWNSIGCFRASGQSRESREARPVYCWPPPDCL